MSSLTILLTRRPLWNPVSTMIRAAVPHTAFKLARSSHSIIVDGDQAIEAKMAWMEGYKICSGVRRVPLAEALQGARVVRELHFIVPDLQAGLTFARSQADKRVPYDFKGATGFAIAPTRNWQEDDMWFCHELAAATIHASGLKIFGNVSHITERELIATRFATSVLYAT